MSRNTSRLGLLKVMFPYTGFNSDLAVSPVYRGALALVKAALNSPSVDGCTLARSDSPLFVTVCLARKI